ncbi:MAG: efflux RND transporter permease subunit [Pseudobacteriovorax sp.]|nr:efflux RND transporter permease subunit [Pseudobacteriovorax sp.]
MNKLIAFFARQGIFVDLVTIFVFAVGVFSIVSIKREVFPNVNFDIITVVTPYPGAAAEATERLVTNPLEQGLKEVDGIKKLTSISREGASSLIIQLDPDQTTASEAKEDIQEVIDSIDNLPEDTEDPIVTVATTKQTPTIEIALTGSEVSEDTLRENAKFLEEHLERLPDVAKVTFSGLRDYEVRVAAKPELLKKYEISLPEIIGALANRNMTTPGGTIEATEDNQYQELIVRTVGEFTNAKEVEDTVIRTNVYAEPIRVKDVATVTQEFERATETYKTNGKQSISLTVLKKESGDVLDLVEDIKAKVESVQSEIDPAVAISYINDRSFYVKRRIAVLSNNLIVGLALVLVFLSFVLPWRVAAITAFGIPFSFLGAISVFYAYDISINLISMMGLIIVVGMLVDDAIVVTENTQRFREKGLDSTEAAIAGTRQVWAPVTVSVMTTIIAFAPMLYMSGIFGKFIRYIPLGVIIALAISLWECFFVLPHHLGKWSGAVVKTNIDKNKGFMQNFWERYPERFYLALIRRLIKVRYLVILFTFGLLGGSFYWANEKMSFVLFPPGGVELFVINFSTPNGSSLAATMRAGAPIEAALEAYDSTIIDDYTVKFGVQRKDANDPSSKTGTEYGQAFVFLSPATERLVTAQQVTDELREIIGKPEGIQKISYEQVSGGPPVGKPVNIGIRGKEYEDILPVVDKVKQKLAEIPGVSDIDSTYYLGKKEIHIKVKEAEAVASGLTVADIGRAVRASYAGLVATPIRKLDEELDVRVSLSKSDRSKTDTIDDILVPNSRGQLIPLGRVATYTESQGVSVYRHEDNQRQVSVLAELDTDTITAKKLAETMGPIVDTILKDHPKVTAVFGGENQDTDESIASLIQAFAFAFFGIFLILILLFQNLYQPLVIAATIPLGAISVIWTFYFHDNMPLSFLGTIGVIALAGVIVNNAIVLVDFVNGLLKSGSYYLDAVLEAAKIRLRPIFLTTITTVAGILPTAYGVGGKDPFVVPIALALGWGMAFGAVLTTLLLPSFLVVLNDILNLIRRLFGRKIVVLSP